MYRIRIIPHQMRIIICIILVFIGWINSAAQELTVNGGAESPAWLAWFQPDTPWNSVTSAANAGVNPHGGTYYLAPGGLGVRVNNVTTSEAYQVIDLTTYASFIDAGTASFTFSGWRRGYAGQLDRSQFIVEYRDASQNVLEFYNSGSSVSLSWLNNTDTRNAPVGTRYVRIRLISTLLTGSDNDGYYDDISFKYNPPTCTSPAIVTLTPGAFMAYCAGSPLTISATVSPANTNYYYTWYKNGLQITTASKTYAPFTIAVTATGDAGTYTLRVEDGNTGTFTCYREASVVITIDQPTIAGTINSSQEACFTIPLPTISPLTGTAATGGTAVKYYKWQTSTNPAGPWINVNTQPYSTAATSYAPSNGAGTRYYRRLDSSGTCPVVPTNTVTIRVNSKKTLNPITSLLRDTLCVGENFQLIPPSMGPPFSVSSNGGFYFTWKKVQGATTTTLIPVTLTPGPYPSTPKAVTLADSGTYYLIVQDGLGATKCKDSVKIVIRVNQAASTKAIIQSNQEICLNTAAALLTESSAAVSFIGTPLNYQWYSTKDTTGTPTLNKIPAAVSNTYSPGILPVTIYYVRKDSVKYCPAIKSNFVKVRINNKPILDSIRATVNDTLCENLNDPFQLKGYIDSITAGKASINEGYQFTWKKLQQPATIPVVISSTGKYVDYPALSRPVVEEDSGTYYLQVQDGTNAAQCMDFITLKIVVLKTCVSISCIKPTVVSAKVAATSNDTLCVGSSLTLQKDVITLPSTPPVFGYTYAWVRTNALGTVVVGAASPTYSDLTVASVSLIDSGRYQLIVKDGTITPASCATSSAAISIVIQSPIAPAVIGNDTIICKGNPVLPFTALTANTGGTGIYNHQWQSSPDNSTFTNISAATSVNYQSPPISSTTYFRRIDKSGVCGSSTSNTIKIDAYTGVVPGSISLSPTTVCYNTIPTQNIVSSASASGGTGGSGSEKYQWQRSTDNSTWTAIAGATTLTYKETSALTSTMYYRRQVGMGPGNCDTNYTNSVFIQVYATLVVGSIGSSQSICAGKTVSIIETLPASGGGSANTQTYQWIESSDKGLTWTAAPGAATGKNYLSPVLSDSVWYKRVVISTCGQDSSNYVMIDVDTISHPHVSIGDGFTCQSATKILTANVSNAGISPMHVWQKSSSVNGPWLPIGGATSANYMVANPQPADSGTVYKVIVTSSDICNAGPVTATTVLKVQKSVQPEVLISTNLSGPACDILPSITYIAVPIQGQGTAPTYQWYNGTTNTLLAGETSSNYIPSATPQNGDKVYVIMTSNDVCVTTASVPSLLYTLSLLPTPNPILHPVDTSICIPNSIILTTGNTKPSGTTFQWFNNGAAIDGATNTTYQVHHKDIPGGTYSFMEYNSACSSAALSAATVRVLSPPTVFAGNDIYTYKNNTVTLQGSVLGSTDFVWKPAAGLNNPSSLNPTTTLTNTISYTLYAKDITGTCAAESSVTIYLQNAIKIPNVITPNGDGTNDIWTIEHIEDFPNATFMIYNRWGNIVWKATTNSFEWNGTNYRNGEQLPDGTYFYIIDLKSPAYDEPYTGYIQIVR